MNSVSISAILACSSLRRLAKEIFVAQCASQLPPRVKARGEGNDILIEKWVARFHAVGHGDPVALRTKQQAGQLNLVTDVE